MSTSTNPRGIFSAALIITATLCTLAYCNPAPAAENDDAYCDAACRRTEQIMRDSRDYQRDEREIQSRRDEQYRIDDATTRRNWQEAERNSTHIFGSPSHNRLGY